MGINPFENIALRETFNSKLSLTILLIAVSQFNFGFDQQGFNTTQAMNAFQRTFGSYSHEEGAYYLESWWLSLFTGLPYIGFGCGILIGSSVSKHFGRRWCLFSMSVWSCIATTIIITSENRDQILAARILAYIYIGMELAVVPIYQSEITPGKARGFVVGTYQLSLGVGGLVVNGVARATSSMESKAAFRIVYGLFYVVPVIVICGIWFVPESPRWLAMKGRHDEALVALTALRRGKFSEDEIAEEMNLIRQGIEREVEKGKFLEIFQGKITAKRTAIVCLVNFFLHATGAIFGSVYGAIYIKSLNFVNPFTITTTNSAIQIFTVLISMVLSDWTGRRNTLFIGISIQTAGLLCLGGLGLVNDPGFSVKVGLVTAFCVMTLGFALGWAPVSHMVSAEIPSMRLRDVTYRTCSVVNICTQFLVAFTLPYLLNEPYAALGSRVGFIFGAIAICSAVFVFFCLPECKGRTLEEIDLLFESGVPLNKFHTVKLDTFDVTGKLDGHDGEAPAVVVTRKQ